MVMQPQLYRTIPNVPYTIDMKLQPRISLRPSGWDGWRTSYTNAERDAQHGVQGIIYGFES